MDSNCTFDVDKMRKRNHPTFSSSFKNTYYSVYIVAAIRMVMSMCIIFDTLFLYLLIIFSFILSYFQSVNRLNGQRHLTLNEPCVCSAIHSENRFLSDFHLLFTFNTSVYKVGHI